VGFPPFDFWSLRHVRPALAGCAAGAFGGNFVVRTTDVFTPNKLPVFSYVERGEYNFETRLGDALSIPNMIISLSGPSKSGKTVLVTKVIGQDLIQVSGDDPVGR
jgi:hypothetical protein